MSSANAMQDEGNVRKADVRREESERRQRQVYHTFTSQTILDSDF
jgi:hypothetical protein